MRISLIVAHAQNFVIGNQGKIPWRLKSDMRYFKAVTLGKPVIMGRKTWETFNNRPLPERTNIVVSRSVKHIEYRDNGVVWAPDIETAQIAANAAIQVMENPEILFIGGSDIYKEAIPYCNRMYITTVYTAPEGDAFFPNDSVDWQKWTLTSRSPFPGDEENDHVFDFAVWERRGRIPKPFLYNGRTS